MVDIFDDITEKIKNKIDDPLIHFGEFKFKNTLGDGQQGKVFLAENKNEKPFAIKFYRPTDRDSSIYNESRKRFIREVKILLTLKHRNIVNIYKGGSARWIKSKNQWEIKNTLDNPYEYLYYIMDFIEGDDLNTLFYKKNTNIIDKTKASQKNRILFENLIMQISDAMIYFHSKKIAHRDIKPSNLFYSKQDNTFIIVDFGFAKHYEKKSREYKTIIKKRYIDFESEKIGKVDKKADQFMFSQMLLEIVEIFIEIYPNNYYKSINKVLKKATDERKNRYKNTIDFKNAIKQYLFIYPYHNINFRFGSYLIPEKCFGHFIKKINIPVSGSLPICDEILKIIDTADFQRLRGIRQLGPTVYIYPGANHTRFEHSLGAYHLSLRYLESLLKIPKFHEIIDPIDESIKLIILATLLHDIGHYPYSHWIEEINNIPKLSITTHEKRAKNIIENGEIGEIIKDWGISSSRICDIIAGNVSGEKNEIFCSIIDSTIDVDKIDYLQRDSTHCGVPYGVAFDVPRLINSLYINEEGNQICLTDKGQSPFIALLMSNIIMYQEVYWHKTVRACDSMFKRFFYEFASKFKNKEKISEYLKYDDDKFITTLFEKTKKDKELSKLIAPFNNKGRELYKPVFIFYHGFPKQKKHTKNFFNRLSGCSYNQILKVTSNLIDELNNINLNLNEFDILIETTPVKYREVAELKGFAFWNEKIDNYVPITSEIENMNNYLAVNKRSFIFCNSIYEKKIKDLIKSGKMNEIFGKINREWNIH